MDNEEASNTGVSDYNRFESNQQTEMDLLMVSVQTPLQFVKF